MCDGDRVGLIYSKSYVLQNVERTKWGFSVLPRRNVPGKSNDMSVKRVRNPLSPLKWTKQEGFECMSAIFWLLFLHLIFLNNSALIYFN